jgi:MFS transporter, DHA1 family, arabinose polymer utilization protein
MKTVRNTARIPMSLVTLMIGGVVVGMTEFMMMGVLPDVSNSLAISIPEAGHLISIYALGVVVGAPLTAGLAGHFPPKKMLMGLMGMFLLFNALFAISPGYPLLLVTRFCAGLPHGAFFGMGAVVASRLAEPGREARAISLMFAGLTVANILGVPLGTWVAQQFGWRLSFAVIAIIAGLAILSIQKWMPVIAAAPKVALKESLRIFTRSDVWLIIGISSIGTGGLFAWISYIAPMMIEVTGFDPAAITGIMIVAGLGMAIGNFIGGRLADKYSPLKTTAMLLLTMVVSLLIVKWVAPFKIAAVIMTFITGAIAFAVIAPMQMLMINTAKGAEMLASSTIQASANTGNALGAYLGGLPIAAGFGYTSPQLVGAGLAFTGVIFCIALFLISQPGDGKETINIKSLQLLKKWRGVLFNR